MNPQATALLEMIQPKKIDPLFPSKEKKAATSEVMSTSMSESEDEDEVANKKSKWKKRKYVALVAPKPGETMFIL